MAHPSYISCPPPYFILSSILFLLSFSLESCTNAYAFILSSLLSFFSFCPRPLFIPLLTSPAIHVLIFSFCTCHLDLRHDHPSWTISLSLLFLCPAPSSIFCANTILCFSQPFQLDFFPPVPQISDFSMHDPIDFFFFLSFYLYTALYCIPSSLTI